MCGKSTPRSKTGPVYAVQWPTRAQPAQHTDIEVTAIAFHPLPLVDQRAIHFARFNRPREQGPLPPTLQDTNPILVITLMTPRISRLIIGNCRGPFFRE